MTKLKISYGEVKITLADEEFTMVASIEAARKLNAAYGGLRPLNAEIQNLNLAAYALVIAACVDPKELPPTEIEARLLMTGVNDLLGPFAEFILGFATGFKEQRAKKEVEDAAAPLST